MIDRLSDYDSGLFVYRQVDVPFYIGGADIRREYYRLQPQSLGLFVERPEIAALLLRYVVQGHTFGHVFGIGADVAGGVVVASDIEVRIDYKEGSVVFFIHIHQVK